MGSGGCLIKPILAVTLAVLAAVVLSDKPFFMKIFGILAGLYLPYYFDYTEYTHGVRYWHAAANSIHGAILKCFHWIGLSPRVRLTEPKAYKDYSQLIFASHPHGVMSFHHALLYLPLQGAEELIKAIPLQCRRALRARSLFSIPIFRDLVLMFGAVDASARVASKCLQEGYSLTILPGGEHEQLLAEKDHHVIYVRMRKGFCRLGVKHNVPIVPAYCFGETSTYTTSQFLMEQRKWLAKKFFIALPIAWGNTWWNPLAPCRTSLIHCVGRPIVPPIADPSLCPDDDFRRRVDIMHSQYIEAIQEIFDTNKSACGCPDAKLIIL